MARLLLISTSTVFGTRYLEHAADELQDVLGGVRRVLFVPFALKDRAGYAAKAREAFADMASRSTRCTRRPIRERRWPGRRPSSAAAATPFAS